MNDPFERDLAAWLREGPDRGPDEARRRAYATIRQARQRPAWLVAASGGAGVGRPGGYATRQAAWLMVLVALGLLVLIGAALAGGLFRDPLRADVPPIVTQPSQPPDVATPLPGFTGTIAYSYGGRIELLDPATGNRRTLETEKPAYCPTLSPDGSAIAYQTMRGLLIDLLDGAAPRFLVEASNAGGATPSSEPLVGDFQPTWAPDGSRVAVRDDVGLRIAFVDGRPGTEVSLMDPSEIDANHRVWAGMPAWAPSGDTIAVVSGIAEQIRPGSGSWRPGGGTLQMIDAATGKRRVLAEGPGPDDPIWAPDGRSLFFFHGNAIHRIDIASGEQIPIAGNLGGIPFENPSDALRISGDGRWSVTSRLHEDDHRSLVLIDMESGQQRLVDGGTWIPGTYAWAPDNRHVAAFADTGDRRELVILSIDDQPETRIPLGPWDYEWADLGSRWWDCVSWTPQQLPANVVDAPEPSGDISRSPAPSPYLGSRFNSNLYGYSIGHPAGWTATPATSLWSPREGWEVGPSTDRINGPGGQFTVVATPAPAGMSLDEWIASVLPKPTQYAVEGDSDDPLCVYRRGNGATMFPGGGDDAFEAAPIGGQPGRVRGQCGYSVGVVLVDGRAYVFTLYSGKGPGADLQTFGALVETIRFEDAPPPVRSVAFTSDVYGYSLTHTPAYRAVPATVPWTPPEMWGRASDWFWGPLGLAFSIASTPVEPGTTRAEWELEREQSIPASIACRTLSTPWLGTTIAGHEGAVRSDVDCGAAEAYMIVGERVYIATTSGASDSALLEFLSTIEFHPEDAAPATES